MGSALHQELNLNFLREYCSFLSNCTREIGAWILSGVKGAGGEKASVSREKLSSQCLVVPVLVYKALGHQKLHSSQQPVGEEGDSLIWEVGGVGIDGRGYLAPRDPSSVPSSCP